MSKAKVILISGKQGSGKCLKAGTLVKTPTGSKKIEDLMIGDEVYGYNSDQTVSKCEVTDVHKNGIKKVVDLSWSDKTLVSATIDHRFMSYNFKTKIKKEKAIADFNTKDMLLQTFIKIPGGNKDVPEAYAIGALLGDGCCTINGVVISSSDESVVKKVANSIGAEGYKKLHEKNFNWRIQSPSRLEYYNKWCKGLKAHEKILDINEVKSWNRQSQLDLLAGLIDTDGCVRMRKRGLLTISIGMQAKVVIDAVKTLLLDLFQFDAKIYIDNRPKYKNGPVYIIRIGQNKYTQSILRELPTVCERKKWKDEYEDLAGRSNKNPSGVMFTVSEAYDAETYDISINNDTNLYLLANGFITHNSTTASQLQKTIIESGLTPVTLKFADVIYKMHDAALAVAADYGIPVLKKEGAMLQWFGTEWGRETKGQDVWVNAVRHKIMKTIETSTKPDSLVFIIDDCRFVNEFRGFDDLEESGLVDVIRVRLEAPEEERKSRADSWRTATDHISETDLDAYAASGLFDLYFQTGKDGLQTSYIVSEILHAIDRE